MPARSCAKYTCPKGYSVNRKSNRCRKNCPKGHRRSSKTGRCRQPTTTKVSHARIAAAAKGAIEAALKSTKK